MLPKKIAAQVYQYIAVLNAHDMELMARLYDETATLEDPVGSEIRQGFDAIKGVHEAAFDLDVSARLTGDIRVASNAAAFPFTVFLKSDDNHFKIEIIGVLEYNDGGRIVSQKGYWGPENLSKA